MKNVTKSMLVLLVLAMAVFLTGCDNLFGSDPESDGDYVFTIEVYNGAVPATNEELNTIAIDQDGNNMTLRDAIRKSYTADKGTWNNHKLQLTQADFDEMLDTNSGGVSAGTSRLSVEEFIEIWTASPSTGLTKVNNSTVRMDISSFVTPNPPGPNPGTDGGYVLTIEVYDGDNPATGASLEVGKDLFQGYGTWFDHELKLTQSDFQSLLSLNTSLPATATVEDYIDEMVIPIPGMDNPFTREDSSTLRFDVSLISTYQITGIKVTGAILAGFSAEEIKQIINTTIDQLLLNASGSFSADGKVFTFNSPQTITFINADHMSIDSDGYLVVDYDTLMSIPIE